MGLSRPAALAALGFLLAAPALAQTATPNTTAKPPGTTTAPTTQPSAAQAAQQERMAACNAESGQKKIRAEEAERRQAQELHGRLPRWKTSIRRDHCRTNARQACHDHDGSVPGWLDRHQHGQQRAA